MPLSYILEALVSPPHARVYTDPVLRSPDSSSIFSQSGFSDQSALAASLGFGVINFLFAIPAIVSFQFPFVFLLLFSPPTNPFRQYTIDTFGRRNLLLTTFPLMSLCMLFTGFSFYIPASSPAHVGCIALGIYLFGIVYSPGEGPVPFTYSAEAYPLYVRTIGMSLATATTWFFNFVLSITWLSLQAAFKPQGAFGWYAAWNLVGWWLVLLFMPVCAPLLFLDLQEVGFGYHANVLLGDER